MLIHYLNLLIIIKKGLFLSDKVQILKLFGFLKDKIIMDFYGDSIIFNLHYDTLFYKNFSIIIIKS